MLTTAIPDNGP